MHTYTSYGFNKNQNSRVADNRGYIVTNSLYLVGNGHKLCNHKLKMFYSSASLAPYLEAEINTYFFY